MFTARNTREHLAWIIGKGNITHGNSKGEIIRRNIHKNNSKRVVRNEEGKNVGNYKGGKSQTRPN